MAASRSSMGRSPAAGSSAGFTWDPGSAAGSGVDSSTGSSSTSGSGLASVSSPVTGSGTKAERLIELQAVTRRCDDGHPQAVVPEQLAGNPLDRGAVDRVDRGQCLFQAQHSVVKRFLAAQPRGNVTRIVHPQL